MEMLVDVDVKKVVKQAEASEVLKHLTPLEIKVWLIHTGFHDAIVGQVYADLLKRVKDDRARDVLTAFIDGTLNIAQLAAVEAALVLALPVGVPRVTELPAAVPGPGELPHG